MSFDLSTRAGLGRAITLVESRRADHQAEAREMLRAIMPLTGKAQRIGITGVPGVGKSTFIESFGTLLTGMGTGCRAGG
jgi:LAO/AO transport system kinase